MIVGRERVVRPVVVMTVLRRRRDGLLRARVAQDAGNRHRAPERQQQGDGKQQSRGDFHGPGEYHAAVGLRQA